MNILLTNPKSRNVFETFGFVFPPLGLLYVAASAEKQGFKVVMEDFLVSRKEPSTYNFSEYDVVGITSDTRRFPGAIDIAKQAKNQGCMVVMGGPHPAYVDERILNEGYADFIVRGEGEITFPELLNAVSEGGELSTVRGISYLDNGKVIRTEDRGLIEDLDSLPFPARHLVDISAYKQYGLKYGGKRSVAVMSTSRGCPNECSFCVTPQMYGRRWRARSAGSVISEIEDVYHNYGYRAIAFCDDNFTASPKRVKEICSNILERELDIWWWGLSTANTLLSNEEMLGLMAKAGAKTVYIGVESANPATLQDFNKNIKTDAASRAVALLKKNGLQTFASYIIGGVNDDIKSILGTIKFARALDTEVAQFAILTPYPGTRLFKQIEGSLRHKKWHLFDSTHLVFRHKKVPYFLMQLLLVWAYLSYYTRGWKAVKGFFSAFFNNTPILRSLYGRTN